MGQVNIYEYDIGEIDEYGVWIVKDEPLNVTLKGEEIEKKLETAVIIVKNAMRNNMRTINKYRYLNGEFIEDAQEWFDSLTPEQFDSIACDLNKIK